MKARLAEELLALLGERPLSLEELHERVHASGSSWTPEQVQLFLACAPGVVREPDKGLYRAHDFDPEAELQRAIVEVVRSFNGKPVPATEVRQRLPERFLTTDEQIRALAKRTRGLTIVGPGLIRTAP